MNETNVPRFDAALVNYEPQCEEATTSASDKGLGYLKVSRYVLADRMSGSRNEQAVPFPPRYCFKSFFVLLSPMILTTILHAMKTFISSGFYLGISRDKCSESPMASFEEMSQCARAACTPPLPSSFHCVS